MAQILRDLPRLEQEKEPVGTSWEVRKWDSVEYDLKHLLYIVGAGEKHESKKLF